MIPVRPAPTPPTAPRRPLPPPWVRAAQVVRLPWLLAVVAVCAVAVALAHVEHSKTALPTLLVLAPLLPLLCVASSYGGRADPFAEVTRTTPAGGLRILLIRSGQILLVCMPLLTGVVALVPDDGLSPGAATWLLPALVLTLVTLVGGSYIGCWPAALLTLTGWMLTVAAYAQVLAERRHGNPGPPLDKLLPKVLSNLIGDSAQMWWAIGATVLFHLLMKRRHAFDRAGGRR